MFDFSKVAILIREFFAKPIVEAVRRETVFLSLAEDNIKIIENEKDMRWKVNYAGNASVGSYGETDALGTAGEQAHTTGRLDWKLNKLKIRITGLAQAVSKGPNSIYDAVADEMELAIKDLKRNMNLQMLSDGLGNLNGAQTFLNSGKDLTGIQACVDDGTNVTTYAGIDRAVNLWWKSYVLANGGIPRPITEALMHQVTNELETRGGKVTHIFCSPSVWTAFGNLMVSERRNIKDPMHLPGGWTALDFNGIPVVKVPSYQNSQMDFVDLELFTYRILQEFVIEPRDPGNYDAVEMIGKHYAQFKCESPRMCGSIRDIQAV